MTQTGIDVSEHNGKIGWKEIAEAGVQFAIIRAGYGSAYLDSRFYENVNGAHDAGLKLGVYHFGYARHGGELEVERDFLLSILGTSSLGGFLGCGRGLLQEQGISKARGD